MKFSIVTIAFNQADYLEQAIRSVVEQRGVELEYIVVDPGSTDGSREIIERYGERIAHLVDEPDAGPADGLNKGFARASGDVFGFINADDFLLSGALATVASFLERHPDADAVTGDLLIVDVRGAVRRRTSSPTVFSARHYARGLCRVLQPSTFFRRRAFERTAGFNVANRTCWDGELFLDMSLAGARFARCRELLAGFRLHAAGISGSGRLNAVYRRDQQRLLEKVLGRPPGPWGNAQHRAGVQLVRLLAIVDQLRYRVEPGKSGLSPH
jgi:glycosyltransferase involved in cell wall biosynthesis